MKRTRRSSDFLQLENDVIALEFTLFNKILSNTSDNDDIQEIEIKRRMTKDIDVTEESLLYNNLGTNINIKYDIDKYNNDIDDSMQKSLGNLLLSSSPYKQLDPVNEEHINHNSNNNHNINDYTIGTPRASSSIESKVGNLDNLEIVYMDFPWPKKFKNKINYKDSILGGSNNSSSSSSGSTSSESSDGG